MAVSFSSCSDDDDDSSSIVGNWIDDEDPDYQGLLILKADGTYIEYTGTSDNYTTDRGTYQYNPSTKILKVTVTYTDDDEWDSTPPFTFEEKVEVKGNKLRFLPDEDDDEDDYWEMKRTSKTSL